MCGWCSWVVPAQDLFCGYDQVVTWGCGHLKAGLEPEDLLPTRGPRESWLLAGGLGSSSRGPLNRAARVSL